MLNPLPLPNRLQLGQECSRQENRDLTRRALGEMPAVARDNRDIKAEGGFKEYDVIRIRQRLCQTQRRERRDHGASPDGVEKRLSSGGWEPEFRPAQVGLLVIS